MAVSSPLGVQEVSTTSGTGPYTLAGPTPDHWTFATKIPDGEEVLYEATDSARSEYARGRFEYPATLHRVEIINSSAAGDVAIDWPVTGQTIISLVQEFEPSVGLPAGGDCAQALIKLSDVDYDAYWLWRPYPIAVWIDGAPGANRRIRLAITEPIRLDYNFAGSFAHAGTASTIDLAIAINRIPFGGGTLESLGRLTYQTGQTMGVWRTPGVTGYQYLYPGDMIEFLFPASVGGVANLSFTARAVIVCGVADTLPEPLPEPEEFEVGAVYFDSFVYLWNLPPMEDSPVGSMSYWMYVDNFDELAYPPWPQDGDLHQNNTRTVLQSSSPGIHPTSLVMWSARTRPSLYSPTVAITDITSANPAVVTFSQPHGIQLDAWVYSSSFAQSGTGWVTTFSGKWMQVLSVTSTTMTVDFNTTGYAAYNPASNTAASFQPAHATDLYLSHGVDGRSVQFVSTGSLPARTWINVLRSWDTGHPAGSKISIHYFNDDEVPLIQKLDTYTAFDIGYSNPDDFVDDPYVWGIGSVVGSYGPSSAAGMQCHLAEFWFAPGQFIDFTDPAERAKFRDPDTGKPVSLGVDGSLPTGTAPAIYQTIARVPPDPYTHLGLPLRLANLNYCWVESGSGTLANAITTSRELVFSCWVWGDTDFQFYGNGDESVYIGFGASGPSEVLVQLHGTTFANVFSFSFPYHPVGVKNIRFAVDTNYAIGAKVVYAYVNDEPATVTVISDNTNNLLVNWVDSDLYRLEGVGFIAAVWIAPDQFFDPVDEFIDEDGNPVALGDAGELPSGTAPSFYFNIEGTQDADEFAVNLGTGGTFTPDAPAEMILVPDGACFLKNNTGGNDLHLSAVCPEFPLADTSPSDVGVMIYDRAVVRHTTQRASRSVGNLDRGEREDLREERRKARELRRSRQRDASR